MNWRGESRSCQCCNTVMFTSEDNHMGHNLGFHQPQPLPALVPLVLLEPRAQFVELKGSINGKLITR